MSEACALVQQLLAAALRYVTTRPRTRGSFSSTLCNRPWLRRSRERDREHRVVRLTIVRNDSHFVPGAIGRSNRNSGRVVEVDRHRESFAGFLQKAQIGCSSALVGRVNAMGRNTVLVVGASLVAGLLILGCSESGGPELTTQQDVCVELRNLAVDGLTTSGRLPNIEGRLEVLLASSALSPAQREAVQKLLTVAVDPPPAGEGMEEMMDATFGFIDMVALTCP